MRYLAVLAAVAITPIFAFSAIIDVPDDQPTIQTEINAAAIVGRAVRIHPWIEIGCYQPFTGREYL